MSDHSRLGIGLVCVVSSLSISAFIEPAFALGTCAAYGPDFALVEGTHNCVRIGGHLRVQFEAPAQDDHFSENRFGAAATSAALRSDGTTYPDAVAPRHMRVDTTEESYR
jgi:hypothetical protein